MSKKIVFALLSILASLTLVVPSYATETTATYFLLPYILATPKPGVLLQNPTRESVTVMLNAFGHTGDLLGQILVTLGPAENKALFVGDIKEGLPKGTTAVRAESDEPLTGSTIFGASDAPLATLPAFVPASSALDFPYPYRQSDTWATYFLFNPNVYSMSLTFRALDKDGSLLAERTLAPLVPQETRIVLIEDIVGISLLPLVATVRVSADSPIIGVVFIDSSQEEGFHALPGLPLPQAPGAADSPPTPREGESTEPQARESRAGEPSSGVSLCNYLGSPPPRTVQFSITKGFPCSKGGIPCESDSCLCTVPANTITVGGPECLGRCGSVCDDPTAESFKGAFVYTEACLIHDLCAGATGKNDERPCKDEYIVARRDWLVEGTNCSVTGLKAAAASSNQINLSWDDNFSESGFAIRRKTGLLGPWTQIDTLVANTRSYKDNDKGKGLKPDTRYSYQVGAYLDNLHGPMRFSEYSKVAIATTLKTKTLTGVSVSGPSSVNRGACADYTARASFSDGTSQDVTSSAQWTKNSFHASISSSGRLCVLSSLPFTQNVPIAASYTYNGTTRTRTKMVQLVK